MVPGPCRAATGATRPLPPAAPTVCGVTAGPCAGGWGGSRLPQRPPGSAPALPRSGIAARALPGVRAQCLPCFPAAQPALLPWLPAFCNGQAPGRACHRLPASPVSPLLHLMHWSSAVAGQLLSLQTLQSLPAGVSLRVSCRFALACVRAPTVTHPSLCAPGVTRLYTVLAHAPVCLCGFIGACRYPISFCTLTSM